jgi:hypothetical protein
VFHTGPEVASNGAPIPATVSPSTLAITNRGWPGGETSSNDQPSSPP